jgi:hypothetical protein
LYYCDGFWHKKNHAASLRIWVPTCISAENSDLTVLIQKALRLEDERLLPNLRVAAHKIGVENNKVPLGYERGGQYQTAHSECGEFNHMEAWVACRA